MARGRQSWERTRTDLGQATQFLREARRQSTASAHRVGRAHRRRWDTGPDQIDTVERRFGLDASGPNGPGQRRVGDLHGEMLRDPTLVDDAADAQPDLGAAQQTGLGRPRWRGRVRRCSR